MKINKNVCFLVARLIIGGIFINAGWLKVSAMALTVTQFGSMGLAPFFAYLVGYAELIGGVLLVLGLYVELASLVLAIIMLVAIYLTRSLGFQMYAMPLTVLAGVVGLMGSGAGKYAVRLGKSDN